MQWTWKYADWLMIIIAVVIGVGVFFLPSNDKKLDELRQVAAERKAKLVKLEEWEKRKAEAQAAFDAQNAKEAEELGIIYVPINPKLQPAPQAPAKKPAEKGK